jgi:hypothetical protein
MWRHEWTSLESRLSEGVDCILFEYFILRMYVIYDRLHYDYVYALLTLFLLVDACLMMFSNLTHIRSKGAMHKNQTFEGEVWQHPCHILLALSVT